MRKKPRADTPKFHHPEIKWSPERKAPYVKYMNLVGKCRFHFGKAFRCPIEELPEEQLEGIGDDLHDFYKSHHHDELVDDDEVDEPEDGENDEAAHDAEAEGDA